MSPIHLALKQGNYIKKFAAAIIYKDLNQFRKQTCWVLSFLKDNYILLTLALGRALMGLRRAECRISKAHNTV